MAQATLSWPSANSPCVRAKNRLDFVPALARAGSLRRWSLPYPKPSPWGGGGPAKPGRMRGRSCTQPFLVEKGRTTACRPNGIFLLPRWANRSPPHQSPSVTASPPRGSLWVVQPYTKKRPKSGYGHGPRNSPTIAPLRPTTPKRASESEQALNQGGPGGNAPGALSSGFLRRKPGSRPESGGKPTSQGPPCAGPNQDYLPIRQPPTPLESERRIPP